MDNFLSYFLRQSLNSKKKRALKPLISKLFNKKSLVRKMGLEPTRYCYHRHLKPARLPFHHFRFPYTDALKRPRDILSFLPTCVKADYRKKPLLRKKGRKTSGGRLLCADRSEAKIEPSGFKVRFGTDNKKRTDSYESVPFCYSVRKKGLEPSLTW